MDEIRINPGLWGPPYTCEIPLDSGVKGESICIRENNFVKATDNENPILSVEITKVNISTCLLDYTKCDDVCFICFPSVYNRPEILLEPSTSGVIVYGSEFSLVGHFFYLCFPCCFPNAGEKMSENTRVFTKRQVFYYFRRSFCCCCNSE